jgi:hypothetical protein
MASASCPARWGQQPSLRRVRRVSSWASARSPGPVGGILQGSTPPSSAAKAPKTTRNGSGHTGRPPVVIRHAVEEAQLILVAEPATAAVIGPTWRSRCRVLARSGVHQAVSCRMASFVSQLMEFTTAVDGTAWSTGQWTGLRCLWVTAYWGVGCQPWLLRSEPLVATGGSGRLGRGVLV